ncbi:hypothetical protein JCM19000A_14080 [Silvimonas sp. JCM 19000]
MTISKYFNVVINPYFEVRAVNEQGQPTEALHGMWRARMVESPFAGVLRAVELRLVKDAPPVYITDGHPMADKIDWYHFPHRSALFTPTAQSVRANRPSLAMQLREASGSKEN